jgi:hypothetical protein
VRLSKTQLAILGGNLPATAPLRRRSPPSVLIDHGRGQAAVTHSTVRNSPFGNFASEPAGPGAERVILIGGSSVAMDGCELLGGLSRHSSGWGEDAHLSAFARGGGDLGVTAGGARALDEGIQSEMKRRAWA